MPALEKHTDDPDPIVRKNVSWALGPKRTFYENILLNFILNKTP